MIRAILSFFGFIFSWITIGLVMAAFTIGAVLWMYSRDLPNHEQLAQYAPPTISRIYSGEGRLMDEFAEERRLFTASEDIPELVKHAFISAEDKNFYIHKGYDARGMVSALIDAIRTRGETLRGASTITQQVMKNFLLSGDRTGERKIKEIILATRLEETLSKEEILELYLNEIFLGQNSYGVAAAARTYFNKTLEELTPAEAAYLAALPKAPSNYHPVREKAAAIDRRNFVLREMFENGYIDEARYQAARASDLVTVQGGAIASFKSTLPPRDYFTDEIRRQLSDRYSEDEFFGGGLAIRATVDPELQTVAARELRAGLEKYDRAQGEWRGPLARIDPAKLAEERLWREALRAVDMARDIAGWAPAVVLDIDGAEAVIGVEGVETRQGGHRIPAGDAAWIGGARHPADVLAVGDVVHVRAERDDAGEIVQFSLCQIPEIQGGFMAMDVETGRVLAMQGGFSYQDSVFNRATQATRQPGSAFKPLVYAAALDSGYTPATIVIDAPIEVETADGIWRPRNASRKFYGPTPLRTGIERSRNLMTIRLAQEIGMETVAEYAERFGVYEDLQPYLANALGSQETTLFDMVAAYAMFANGGERVEPTLVDRVQDRWGRTIYRHDSRDCLDCRSPRLSRGEPPTLVSNRTRVIDAITAHQLRSMMTGVVERGTAAGRVNLGVPTAGKTGTTNDAKDVWFIGFTSNIVAGCYMGMDRPEPLGRGAFGGSMCAPVFNAFMQRAVDLYGGSSFKTPPGGRYVKIDRYTGERLPNDASGPNVVAEYFREGDEPLYGVLNVVDGGFAMGSNLPMFNPGEEPGRRDEEGLDGLARDGTAGDGATEGGNTTSFGSMSAGGLY